MRMLVSDFLFEVLVTLLLIFMSIIFGVIYFLGIYLNIPPLGKVVVLFGASGVFALFVIPHVLRFARE